METVLSFSGCRIVINDNLITCSYPIHFSTKRWEIRLSDTEIFYKAEGKKEISFPIDQIKELEFEMGNGGNRYEDIPAVTAYVILKTDSEPQNLFYFMIREQYTLLNQTKAHEFCSEVLKHVSERYGIPAIYKLSIDTKQKRKAIAMVPLLLILIFILLWLRLKCN